MIKTKIISTLGPASSSEQTISTLINGGVDVFRLNFSHGTLEEHHQMLTNLKTAGRDCFNRIATLGDLAGPKIRVSKIYEGGAVLDEGSTVKIYGDDREGTAESFGCSYERIVSDVWIGQRVLIDDGNIELEVLDRADDHIACKVVRGGYMRSQKGLNLPDTDITLPTITERDWKCVDWAIDNRLDFLAVSFVRRAADITELKQRLEARQSDIAVIAKIEKPQAVENIESIIDASDGVLVARGDMGVEMDLAEVPVIQKRILRICREKARLCIVATQMLESMIEKPVPTRAEVSDAANAIFDQADAVMLSGETAIGQFPVQAVRYIERVAAKTESCIDSAGMAHPHAAALPEGTDISSALAGAVADLVDTTAARLVAAWSHSGWTIRYLSNSRLPVPVVAVTDSESVCRRLNLNYGVLPFHKPVPESLEQFSQTARQLILSQNLAQKGERIILVAGRPLQGQGPVSSITVCQV